MAFQFGERPDSRGGVSGTDGNETREYFSIGSVDPDYIRAIAKTVAPASISTDGGILYRQPMTLRFNGLHCEISVPYGKQEKESGSYTISFDTTGGTVNMKSSYEVIGKWDTDGDAAASKDDEGGAIAYDGTETVEGTDVVIPALKLTVAFRHPAATINEAHIINLARNSGKVNSDTFLGFDPGEVLFLGATGSESEAEAEVTYQFACSENVTGLAIGGITIDKDGWDFADVRFASETVSGKPVKPPKEIYVHRVYRRTALSSVVGFGS